MFTKKRINPIGDAIENNDKRFKFSSQPDTNAHWSNLPHHIRTTRWWNFQTNTSVVEILRVSVAVQNIRHR